MNHFKRMAFLLFLSASGCSGIHLLDTRGMSTPVPQAAPQPLPPGPVTADIVEAGNAHRAAEAMWDEMDRDQQKDSTSATSKDAKKR